MSNKGAWRTFEAFEAKTDSELSNVRFNIQVREKELAQLRDKEAFLLKCLAVAKELAEVSYWQNLLRLIRGGA